MNLSGQLCAHRPCVKVCVCVCVTGWVCVNFICMQNCFVLIVMLTVNAFDRVSTASVFPSIFHSHVLVS